MELKIIEKFTVKDKYSFENKSIAQEYLNLLDKFEKDYLPDRGIDDLNKNRKIIQETLYNYYSYLDKNIKIDKINFLDFGPKELLSINEALKHNLDIKWINNPKYNNLQMLEIIRGLKNNLNVSWYANPEFTHYQMEEIRFGLQSNVDVSWYAKSEFNHLQMTQIRLGLEAKLDPTLYAYSDISADKIGKIIKVLIEE